jgi:hypothetical protein
MKESERRFADAGFCKAQFSKVPLVWQLPSPDAFFDAVVTGLVRAAAVLQAQTPDALMRIRAAVRDKVSAFARDGAVQYPMPAVIASAEKQ